MFFEKEYAVGRVRAMRARLIGHGTQAEIQNSRNVSGMMLLLGGTPYEHAFAKRNLEHNERELGRRPAESMKKVLEFLPKNYYDCLSSFSLEADAKNLKMCIRGFFGGMKWKRARQDLFECGIVFDAIKGEDALDLDALCSLLAGTVWQETMKKCLEYPPGEIALIEHEIDRFVFAKGEEAISESVRRFFLEKKEIHDLRIMAIAEDAGVTLPKDLLFLPGLEEHISRKYAHLRVGSLEKNIRAHMLSLARELMLLEPFSYGLLIDYFERSLNEASLIAGIARRISSKVQLESGA